MESRALKQAEEDPGYQSPCIWDQIEAEKCRKGEENQLVETDETPKRAVTPEMVEIRKTDEAEQLPEPEPEGSSEAAMVRGSGHKLVSQRSALAEIVSEPEPVGRSEAMTPSEPSKSLLHQDHLCQYPRDLS